MNERIKNRKPKCSVMAYRLAATLARRRWVNPQLAAT